MIMLRQREGGLQVEVSGYLSEIVCGQIPVRLKETFTRYLQENRAEGGIPYWLKKRRPDYVPSEEIERVWYADHRTMADLSRGCGGHWRGHRAVNHFYHRVGFGSGKGDVGLFTVTVFRGEERVMEFVPFEPPPADPLGFRNLADIPVARIESPPLPCPDPGEVAVSAGSWGKGAKAFRLGETGGGFKEEELELMVSDVTSLGIGEDHFVTGLRYGGRELRGEIIRRVEEQRYPVSWYSPAQGRWLQMYESGSLRGRTPGPH
jgi:hypothetical protein